MSYIPPAPQDLQRLKNELGATGKQMARLACVSEQHWRRYTGGAEPRLMPYPNLFHLAAQLELDSAVLERVFKRMRAIGADGDWLLE